MEVYNRRITRTKDSSLGILSYNGFVPSGFIIEDEYRAEKLLGETRIPAGRYKLGIRKELTRLTQKHRESKYYQGWFEYHIEVLDVPNFTGIYFHMVNNDDHTAGCQGGAKNAHIKNGEFTCSNSTELMKEFYSIVYPRLEAGEDVYYTVIDE
jgi:hypothetical protein